MNNAPNVRTKIALVNYALGIFDGILRMLHPVMPFLTEELWHQLSVRDDLILAQWVATDSIPEDAAASADIEVKGISVDVTADSAEEARAKGWREAQRKAWAKINGPELSDGQLDGLVSAIVIERERLGPRRYIATLGVVFDRQRASGYLGGAQQAARSAPMLLIPLTTSAVDPVV